MFGRILRVNGVGVTRMAPSLHTQPSHNAVDMLGIWRGMFVGDGPDDGPWSTRLYKVK